VLRATGVKRRVLLVPVVVAAVAAGPLSCCTGNSVASGRCHCRLPHLVVGPVVMVVVITTVATVEQARQA
jgi:hypothetical protein